jgi:TamB, inner membrane protein subunit of TAM complex
VLGAFCFYIYPDNKWVFYFLLLDWIIIWFLVFKKFSEKLLFLLPLIIFPIIGFVLQMPSIQTKLTKKAAAYFSEKLHTKVSVKYVDIGFFNKVMIEGVLVEDLKKDTLLYAGTIKGNVTDLFFSKGKFTPSNLGLDNITIENVGLDDVVVNLHRSDSVWNYQFISDYFSSPNKKKKTGGKDPIIDLKEMHLTNVRFSQIDEWLGEDMIVKLGKLDAITDLIDIEHKKIQLKSIEIDKPYFAQNDYDGKRPSNTIVKVKKETSAFTNKYQWNPEEWDIRATKIELKDGSYKNDAQTDYPAYVKQFDGQHMLFYNINATIKNIVFVKDTIKANIALSTKEKSGLDVKRLNAAYKLTPDIMEFAGLDLMTNNSRLKDYYAMEYKSFNKDFANFLENVSLKASFKESSINTNDIAIFAPELKSWKRIFKIEGNAKGTLKNFMAKDMKISTGDTYIDGDISMHGLPNIKTTFIDFQSRKLHTTYKEIASIFPEIKEIEKPAMQKLGAVSFRGSFAGFISDFVAYGNINTGLGDIVADVNMKIPAGKPPQYIGSLASKGFNIGQFINVKELGNIALDVKIDGTGFGLKELKENVKGTVNNIDVAGYNYKNIAIDGKFENKLFEGHASIADPNLSIKSLDGSINFMEKSPGFKLQAQVQKADLKSLGFVKEKFVFKGDLDLNFTGNNIDNFLGNAKITNANLLQGENKLSFDFLNVNSEIVGGKKSLTVKTNELDANVTGDFKVMELPDAVTVLLAKYYPIYIKAPKYNVKSKQDFDFSIRTNNVESYVKLLDKRLSGFNNTTVNGHFNLQDYNLNLNATVPQFAYDKKEFNNIVLEANGNRDTLKAEMAIDRIIISDSLQFPFSKIQLTANNDVSLIKLNTTASKVLGDAELNASVQTLNDGVKINFFPSSFIINNKKWELEKNGELVLRRQFINASEVKFFHDDQAIILRTTEDLQGATSDTRLVAELKNIDIEDFAFILPNKPALKGKVTGEAALRNIFGKKDISFKGAAENFNLDGKLIGKINIEDASYNPVTGQIKYEGDVNEKDFSINFNGGYNTKDSTGNALQNTIITRRLDLSILEPYLSGVFSKVSGFANGKLQLKTKNNKLQLTGNAEIEDGNLLVGFTQVNYLLKKQAIEFGENSINLGTMQIEDVLGNKGMVSGIIYHNSFDDFSFSDVHVSSPKMLLLNTTKKDNKQFYGKVIGRADMQLRGNITGMTMDIEGEPSADTKDSSHVYLPIGDSKESNSIDYIEFVQFGSLMKEAREKEETNIKINLDLIANEACLIDVILDEATKDVIKGQGNGRLKIAYRTNENMSMTGQYKLTGGKYTYNFQNFINTPFALNEGGTVTWSGDPLAAVLDLSASYTAKNVDLTILQTNGNSSDPNASRIKDDIIIVSNITGLLKTPAISFQFDLQPKSELNRDEIIKKKLADFKNDDNETLKQVASLLLFNQFISGGQGFLANGTIPIVARTIGGVVSGWLTNTLNNAISKATKGKLSIDIDVNPSLQQANQLQANIRAKFKYDILKNLQLSVGGNIDYNNPFSQLTNTNVITPDFSLDWLINKDGSLRVIAFRRSSLDLISTQGQQNFRTGMQIAYRKNVERLGDIFRSKAKIAYLDSLEKTKPVAIRKK